MQYAKTKMVCIAILSVFLLSACKKDPVEQDCQRTLAGISGSYKLTSLQYKMNASATPVDYLAFMDACEKDDVIVLKANGTYDYNDVGTVCTPSGTDNGVWSVAGNVITSDGMVNGVIESFDCQKLVCYIEDVYTTGDRLTMTITRQ